jgi:hypothetical protein
VEGHILTLPGNRVLGKVGARRKEERIEKYVMGNLTIFALQLILLV